MLNGNPASTLKASALAAGVTEEEWGLFVAYSATFYSNMGNYKVNLHITAAPP